MTNAKREGAEAPSATPKPDVKNLKPEKPPNPVWKMLGLPNMRLKLPSRNWMIFLSVTGSITAAVVYDKRETKRAQRKWAKLVEHLANEPLEEKTMPRKLTVFLEAPPADGLRIAQDHFKDYIKPILVASGLDWDFVQGRKEGDVRAEIAENIRKRRLLEAKEIEEEDPLLAKRKELGIKDFDGPLGDIVIGRHTWKEYVRGLHEGWLGPLQAPPPPPAPEPAITDEFSTPSAEAEPETLPGITIHESTPADPEKTPEPTPADKNKKPPQPPPFISTADYATASTPAILPAVLDPSIPITFPHILGFFNTGIRMYRFFNRRHLADDIGRDVAAIILSQSRPYHSGSSFASVSEPSTDGIAIDSADLAEQATELIEEEKDWHKSVLKREEGEKERTWLEPIVLDPRIAERMRRSELSAEDEERAKNFKITEEEIEGWIKGSIRKGWRAGKQAVGLGEKKRHPSEGLVEDERDVEEYSN